MHRLPAARRQDPGHGRVRRRTGRCASTRSSSPPSTQPTSRSRAIREDVHREGHPRRHPRRACSTRRTKYFINPTGRFVVGGPQGDCGLTGRKIIVDTYGGMGRHGGGAFSGKDPTKVDRSACYMARYIAKNIVAAGLAERAARCSSPTPSASPIPSRSWWTPSGTGKVEEHDSRRWSATIFPLTPQGIIEYLDLRRPIYKKTAAYGHFGRNEAEFTWERTDKVEDPARAAEAVAAADPAGARRPSWRAAATPRTERQESDEITTSRTWAWPRRARQRIEWAGHQMPVLRSIRERFAQGAAAQGHARLGVPARDHRDRQPGDHPQGGRRRGGAVRLATRSPRRTTWRPRW